MNSLDESTLQALGTVADAILEKKGEDLLIYDVRETSSLTQFFFIATGNNVRQNQAIAEEIEERMRKLDSKPLHREPGRNSGWTLLDYGYMIIHIFLPEKREFYDLEGLWGDAQTLPPEKLAEHAA